MAKSKDGLTAWEAKRLVFPRVLKALLADGSWYATGLRTPIDPNKHSEHIPAHLWDVLNINFEGNTASGGGLEYVRLWVYEGEYERRLTAAPSPRTADPLAGKDGIVEPPEPAEAERRQLDRHPRKRNVEADALLENNIKTVLAKAKNRWPDPETCPGVNQMAKMLVEGEPNKKVGGYSEEAIRKILSGTYKPAKDRGIPGLGSG